MPTMIRSLCRNCNKEFYFRTKGSNQGRGIACSRSCAGSLGRKKQIENGIMPDQKGDKNPNWKGGISKNNYHYKRIQIERYPEKIRARQIVKDAIKSGKLIRKKCEFCNEIGQGHHEDYSRPLEVMWLCGKHHRIQHGGKN